MPPSAPASRSQAGNVEATTMRYVEAGKRVSAADLVRRCSISTRTSAEAAASRFLLSRAVIYWDGIDASVPQRT